MNNFWILLTLNTTLYGIYCYLGYVESFKTSTWFTPLCLALIIAGNLLWIFHLKNTSNPNEIFIAGLIWDALITAAFTAVPFVFFDVKLTKISIVGLILCILGLGLLKGGDYLDKKLSQNNTSQNSL